MKGLGKVASCYSFTMTVGGVSLGYRSSVRIFSFHIVCCYISGETLIFKVNESE